MTSHEGTTPIRVNGCSSGDENQDFRDVLFQDTACLNDSFHQDLLANASTPPRSHRGQHSREDYSCMELAPLHHDSIHLRKLKAPVQVLMDDASTCCSTTCMEDSVASLRLYHASGLEDSMASLRLHHSSGSLCDIPFGCEEEESTMTPAAPIAFRRVLSEPYSQRNRIRWARTSRRRRRPQPKRRAIQSSQWGNASNHLSMARQSLAPISIGTKSLPRELDLLSDELKQEES